MKTILITGATGAVGPRVVDAVLAQGAAVRILALDAPGEEGIHREGAQRAQRKSVEFVMGSVTEPDVVREAMEGCEGVIHMAALLHIVDPGPELEEKYRAVNVDGTRVVTEAAVAAGVERLVFFSTIAVYGPGGADVITEESPAEPDTLYGETKLAAEKIVLAARRSDGQPLGTVLRMGAIYGAGIKGNYRRLADALAKKRYVAVGPGENRRTLVYDKDAAAAAALALNHPAAAGQIFNVTDGEFHTLNEIVAAMAAALGRKPPRVRLPVWPVRVAARMLDPVLTLAMKKPPKLSAAVEKYLEEIVVSGEKIERELGFVPEYGLERGWRPFRSALA